MADKKDVVKFGEIISKCWEDEAYKRRFIQDPEGVLEEAGLKVEEGVTYKVVEAPKLVQYVVLPYEKSKEAVQTFAKFLLNKADATDEILPEGVEVRIIQDTEDIRYLILPASPKMLTAAELGSISGGDSTTTATNVVAQAEVTVQAVEVEEVATTTTTVAEAEVGVAAAAVAVVAAAIVLI